jgi:hypothetical protein
MLVEKIDHGFGETSAPLRFRKSKEGIARVYGGYAHPGANPGFCVAVGELWEKDQATDVRPYVVLAEASEPNPSDLVRAAATISRSCQVEIWFGDDKDRGQMELIRRQAYSIRMTTAPYIEDADAFSIYLLMIREKTAPARKLLHFGSSAIPGILSTIRGADVTLSSKALFERYPQVTALGFALAGLETRSFNPHEAEEIQRLTEIYCGVER